MIQIEQTKTIQIDDTLIEVSGCSNEIKQLVVYLDDWRQKEVDLTSDLLRTRAALNDLRNSMIQQFQQEEKERLEQEAVVNEDEQDSPVTPVEVINQPKTKKKKVK